jgi:hypothetical protein
MWHLTSRFASKRPQQRHSIFANSATATSLAIAEYLRSTSSMSQKSGPASQVLRGPRNAISCKLDPQSTKFAETESAGEGAGGGLDMLERSIRFSFDFLFVSARNNANGGAQRPRT